VLANSKNSPRHFVTPPSANRGALERAKLLASLLAEGGGSAEPEGVEKTKFQERCK